MKQAEIYLKILLRLIAVHSFTVAMCLILLGQDGIRFFGFDSGNPFFQVQGGVFHLVMCVAYILASLDPIKKTDLIFFIIAAKFIATIYLCIYYFVITPVPAILLSGVADGLMGLAVYLLYLSARKHIQKGVTDG